AAPVPGSPSRRLARIRACHVHACSFPFSSLFSAPGALHAGARPPTEPEIILDRIGRGAEEANAPIGPSEPCLAAPGCAKRTRRSPPRPAAMLGDSLAVELAALTRAALVRIQVPQPTFYPID